MLVYAFIPRAAQRFSISVRNKSAIELKVPRLPNFINLCGVDLVLNHHIVLLVRARAGIGLADKAHDAH